MSRVFQPRAEKDNTVKHNLKADITLDMDGYVEPTSDDDSSTHLSILLDKLTDKKLSAREPALTNFLKHAQTNIVSEFMDNSLTVLDTLVRSIKRGTTISERTLAARVLSIFYATIGPGNEEIFKTSLNDLRSVILENRDDNLSATCVDALALCCFLCSDEPDSTTECMNFFEGIFNARAAGPLTIIASLEGWSLLETTVSSALVQANYSRVVHNVSRFFDSPHVEVRTAAGLLLALLFESLYARIEDFHPDDAVLNAMENRRDETGKQIGRKDRLVQSKTFDQLLATITTGEAPLEPIKIGSEQLEFDSWVSIRHLDALRNSLAEAFQLHAEENPTVRDVLGLGPAPVTERPSRAQAYWDKHALQRVRQAHSKWRERQIAKERREKSERITA